MASHFRRQRGQIVKLTAKHFDPIGFLTPFTVELKIVFQELCLERVDWDAKLQGDTLQSWKSLLEEIQQRTNFPLLFPFESHGSRASWF